MLPTAKRIGSRTASGSSRRRSTVPGSWLVARSSSAARWVEAATPMARVSSPIAVCRPMPLTGLRPYSSGTLPRWPAIASSGMMVEATSRAAYHRRGPVSLPGAVSSSRLMPRNPAQLIGAGRPGNTCARRPI